MPGGWPYFRENARENAAVPPKADRRVGLLTCPAMAGVALYAKFASRLVMRRKAPTFNVSPSVKLRRAISSSHELPSGIGRRREDPSKGGVLERRMISLAKFEGFHHIVGEPFE